MRTTDKRYKYNYNKRNKNIRIVTPIQFNRFNHSHATPCLDNPQEWKDDKYDIIYNHIYYSPITHEPYIVIQRYFLNNETKFAATGLKLKIQFIPTCTVMQISYSQFLDDSVVINDPYYPNMFNGRCAIGNIVIDSNQLQLEYDIWIEMMRRCYDPAHGLYHYYGGCGARPAFPEWHIYELFHRYFESAYYKTDLRPDVNDPMMYYYEWDHNRTDRMYMARQPVESIPDYRGLPQWMSNVPFRERPKIEYTSPGRPRKEPSPNLIRHVDDKAPRVQLYSLVEQRIECDKYSEYF